MNEPRTLAELLTAICPDEDAVDISVSDILDEVGNRSFAPLVLVPALLLVSPLSAIPGVPTIGGLLVMLVALQWVFARNRLWLPGFVLRRTVAAPRVARAVEWLRKPADWVDRHSQRRLKFLTMPPLTLIPKLAILLVAASWPLLEILPMVTSVGAFAVSLLAFGMMTRDGVFVAAGYASIAGAAALINWLTALA